MNSPIAAQGRILDDGLGRFPANLIHDGSDEVVGLFPETHARGNTTAKITTQDNSTAVVSFVGPTRVENGDPGDSGSAARFFYCAKASKADRDEGCGALPIVRRTDGRETEHHTPNLRTTERTNFHPTVKPTDLMRYLCRLVTQLGGTVLDPFMGSGSTGKAAMAEGFRFIGIERDPDYFRIAEARVASGIPRQMGLF
jgi:site-specific DNA-methyltransferase (adenine-specific)